MKSLGKREQLPKEQMLQVSVIHYSILEKWQCFNNLGSDEDKNCTSKVLASTNSRKVQIGSNSYLTLQTHSKTYCLRYASLYSYLCILSYKLSIELHVVTL